jgi:hypothetical protein
VNNEKLLTNLAAIVCRRACDYGTFSPIGTVNSVNSIKHCSYKSADRMIVFLKNCYYLLLLLIMLVIEAKSEWNPKQRL